VIAEPARAVRVNPSAGAVAGLEQNRRQSGLVQSERRQQAGDARADDGNSPGSRRRGPARERRERGRNRQRRRTGDERTASRRFRGDRRRSVRETPKRGKKRRARHAGNFVQADADTARGRSRGAARTNARPKVIPGDIAAFVKSCAIGAAIAAPVGPMCVLLMRRTLAQGPGFGLATGAGIAAGDGAYALVAALGLGGLMRFMVAYERPLHLAAGAFLVYLGWRTFFGRISDPLREASRSTSLGAAFASALLLTLTNPPTIVSFMAVFAVLQPSGSIASSSAAMAGGVFTGSLLWWLLVTALVGAARHVLGPRTRQAIDRLSGALLGVLGAAELRRAM
jgi:threonine/homoserine/homoserine lactone efflux protein